MSHIGAPVSQETTTEEAELVPQAAATDLLLLIPSDNPSLSSRPFPNTSMTPPSRFYSLV